MAINPVFRNFAIKYTPSPQSSEGWSLAPNPSNNLGKRVRESTNGANRFQEMKSVLVWLFAAFHCVLSLTCFGSRVPRRGWVDCGRVLVDRRLLPFAPVIPGFRRRLLVMGLVQTKHPLGGFRGIFRGWFRRFLEGLVVPLGIAWQIDREVFVSFKFKIMLLRILG